MKTIEYYDWIGLDLIGLDRGACVCYMYLVAIKE